MKAATAIVMSPVAVDVNLHASGGPLNSDITRVLALKFPESVEFD